MALCTRADVFAFGLPRDVFPFPARLIASVAPLANTLELDGHGLELNDPVQFRAESGGSLPAPITEGTTYYAIPIDDYRFAVSASPSGSALDVTTAGSRVLLLIQLPVEAAITWASRIVEDSLPAHVLPLTEPPAEQIRLAVAELAACRLAARLGSATKSVADTLASIERRLARWASGVPVRGTNAPASAVLAVLGSAPTDVRGWRRYGGIG